jgi:arylsulfatase A-like enzyme
MRVRLPRSAFVVTFFLVCVAGVKIPHVMAEGTQRLNVLFIAADDLRNDLGCYDHPLVKTPNLDRLSTRGITFNRAYCQQTVCNPSRASLLTGRRPDTLGIWDLPTHFREVAPDVVTLPQHFKQHGYFTQNIGKIFHNWRQKIEGDPASWSVPAVMHYARHGSDTPRVGSEELPPNHAIGVRNECRDVPDQAYFDGRIANLAVTALSELKRREEPFFLAVGFWKPHLPFNPPKKYWDLYRRNSFAPASNSQPPRDVPEIALHNGRELLSGGRQLSREEIVELRHGYLAGISYLDAQVGKVLAELKRLKLDDSTVIVFWSDHGFHLGEHSLWCKTSTFELDARVPLIIVPPSSRQAGSKTDALVELLDLYPTLVDLCGLPRPKGLEGVSLKPVLDDPQATVKPAAFTQHPRPAYYKDKPQVMGVSVRTARLRYTEWRDFKSGRIIASELYDHDTDPDENTNVIASPPNVVELQTAKKLLAENFQRRDRVAAHRLKYRAPNTQTDLGVGLWAWPMPIDWDGDGDYDLVVSCPDVPFRGTYLFENPGTDGKQVKFPVFKPPVLVGPRLNNATMSVVDGVPRVLSPGFEHVDFLGKKFGKQVRIYDKTNIHPKKIRANQWRYVDYDADGALDVIVGVGDWTEYGWDNAYDKTGQWQRGPLRGYVYLLRNRGSTEMPDYADPVKVTADGKPVDVYGMPSPNFADFDGDGDLDLLCGEFLDGFSYFQNIGTRTEPRYKLAGRLLDNGQPLHMDLQMIVPTAIDWDRDGDVDLVCGDEDGRVALIENTGRMAGRIPGFLAPVYFQQEADLVKFGALVTPVSVDWDGDGDEDLICGNSAGYVAMIENLDGGLPPRWAPPVRLQAGGTTLRIQAGSNGSIQGPCEAKWGYTTLSVADWDHDGLLDLIVNSIWGKVVWYRNVGEKNRPQLAAATAVEVDWPTGTAAPQPAWNWWSPEGNQLVTQWRTTPAVIDLDQDGLNDLVMLDHEGYLAFFRRTRREDRLRLAPGRRVFFDTTGKPLQLNQRTAGKSGRRKFCFADWDGDGKIDLLVNTRSINLLRNVSTKPGEWLYSDEGPLDTRHLAGHTTSPTVVDWDHDGRPDLLTGAEDGHFYYQPNIGQAATRRETDSLVIELRHVEDGLLGNGERAYSNRTYTWFDVPTNLQGWRFTRTFGGETAFVAVRAKRDTIVTMAISVGHDGVDLSGWKAADGKTFGYTDGVRTRMQIFVREVEAGQRIVIPQGTWTGGLLLLPNE